VAGEAAPSGGGDVGGPGGLAVGPAKRSEGRGGSPLIVTPAERHQSCIGQTGTSVQVNFRTIPNGTTSGPGRRNHHGR
jgi:hypothetical protein